MQFRKLTEKEDVEIGMKVVRRDRRIAEDEPALWDDVLVPGTTTGVLGLIMTFQINKFGFSGETIVVGGILIIIASWILLSNRAEWEIAGRETASKECVKAYDAKDITTFLGLVSGIVIGFIVIQNS